jgi:hypothetical protein
VPSGNLGDLLIADGAEAVLLFPEVAKPPPAFESGIHSHVEAFFKVLFPGWIVGIGRGSDLGVPLNADGRGREQTDYSLFSLFRGEGTGEDPAVWPFGGEVLIFGPSARVVPVPPARPTPESLEDGMVSSMKAVFTHGMSVIECPSPDHRVEFSDQFTCRQISAFLDAFPDLSEERFNALLRGGNEELGAFSHPIFADGLPKEIEALLDMGDDGFLR